MNTNDRSERAVKGAASAPISKEQVRNLILEATAAHRKQRELGLCDEDFDAWRHGALYDAVRKTSFREVGQHEFGLALAHFEKLAGKTPSTRWGRANHAIAQRELGAEGDRRRAEHRLLETCERVKEAFENDADQALAYAVVLLRTIHKAELNTATAKQIWQVMFTLTNRAKARLKKQAAARVDRAAAANELEVGVGE